MGGLAGKIVPWTRDNRIDDLIEELGYMDSGIAPRGWQVKIRRGEQQFFARHDKFSINSRGLVVEGYFTMPATIETDLEILNHYLLDAPIASFFLGQNDYIPISTGIAAVISLIERNIGIINTSVHGIFAGVDPNLYNGEAFGIASAGLVALTVAAGSQYYLVKGLMERAIERQMSPESRGYNFGEQASKALALKAEYASSPRGLESEKEFVSRGLAKR